MKYLKLKKKLTNSRDVSIKVPCSWGDEAEIVAFPCDNAAFQKTIVPGESYIYASRKMLDEKDLHNLLDSCLDMWLTAGRFAEQFEDEFAKWLGVRYCSVTNSGSSANLLAISALTSGQLGNRRLKPGDEVITTACAFPSTVAPIIQNKLIPVFLDVDVGTYNIKADQIENALSKKTKAIFLAHTLGNPFELDKIISIADKHKLWVIEDNCDALGSRFDSRLTGTFGHLATHSFYPAHHITMGEGGAVVTDDSQLYRIVNSFRDWGRDCRCSPGKDNSCGKRFSQQFGDLPFGYDHKYVYSHLGYNLKVTDMQAAVGLSQLNKLGGFVESRKRNWRRLYEGLKSLEEFLILPRPTTNSEPSWFGFVIAVKPGSGFTKNELIDCLELHKIGTRMLFAGNIIKQPAFTEQDIEYRVYGDLQNTDFAMDNTFWIGVWPGLDANCIDYMIKVVEVFFKNKMSIR